MSADDSQRYTQQYQHIQEITKLYEEEPDNYTKLVDLLQQVLCLSLLTLSGACLVPVKRGHLVQHLICVADAVASTSSTPRTLLA